QDTQRGNGIRNVALCALDCPVGCNPGEGQAARVRGSFFYRAHLIASRVAAPSETHTLRYSVWRGGESHASLALHNDRARTPVSGPDSRARCASAFWSRTQAAQVLPPRGQ